MNWVAAATEAQMPPLYQCRRVACPSLVTPLAQPWVRAGLRRPLRLLQLLLLCGVVVGPPGDVRLVWPVWPVWMPGVLANTSIWPMGTRSCSGLV